MQNFKIIFFVCWCLLLFIPNQTWGEELAEVIDKVVVAAQENPTDPVAQKRAGHGYLYLAKDVGDNPAREIFGALADFHLDQAVQLDPDFIEAIELLGEASILNHDPSKAANIYEDLVSRQTDPAEGKYLVPLHTCYQWLSDPWRGAAFYRSQLERMPDWPQIKFLLAILLLEIDRAQALDIMWELAGSPNIPDSLKATVRAALKEES